MKLNKCVFILSLNATVNSTWLHILWSNCSFVRGKVDGSNSSSDKASGSSSTNEKTSGSSSSSTSGPAWVDTVTEEPSNPGNVISLREAPSLTRSPARRASLRQWVAQTCQNDLVVFTLG